MITIAVAGGTSPGLGRAVVTAIQDYPDKLHAVVLSRKSSAVPQWLQETGIEVRKVDYNSEDSLFAALQGVHTVLCVLLAADGTWAQTQINLLNAGLRAGIQRFAPAEFGVGGLAAHRVDMFKPSLEVTAELRKAKENNPNFEYAGFHVGLFMNYLGYGAPDAEAATHGMRDTWVFVWDVKKMKASIPLTKEGEIPTMTMTEIGDVGRYVAASCLQPKGSWKEDFSMAGETLKLDEVVRKIEQVREAKMDVVYRPYEQVELEEKEEEVSYPNKFWLQIELLVCRNIVGEGIVSPVVNELCQNVKPLSVDQYLRRFWG
ncbi:hypothetical protein FB567DRAFT_235860 [Paraphoma chrysanthemicola]|uniref:NmrA-like domain-containing protein n=1 Tax=Paraphoma chrysanthemicola TaxID=798071 RepID=A0A8K0RDW1_9PLEO|nr:hypothetical protein FB567DRAFT_235860 [Paraphoma chrysanthemicola]